MLLVELFDGAAAAAMYMIAHWQHGTGVIRPLGRDGAHEGLWADKVQSVHCKCWEHKALACACLEVRARKKDAPALSRDH